MSSISEKRKIRLEGVHPERDFDVGRCMRSGHQMSSISSSLAVQVLMKKRRQAMTKRAEGSEDQKVNLAIPEGITIRTIVVVSSSRRSIRGKWRQGHDRRRERRMYDNVDVVLNAHGRPTPVLSVAALGAPPRLRRAHPDPLKPRPRRQRDPFKVRLLPNTRL